MFRWNAAAPVEDLAEEARLNAARLESVLRLTQMMDASLAEITGFALEQAVALTKSTIGYLAFVNDDETLLTMHAWSKNAMDACAVLDKPLVYVLERTGLWGEAVRQRQPIITNDYQAPGAYKRGLPEGHVPLVRHMNVPVFQGTRIVAVAGVGNKPADYNDADVRHLTLLMEGMWLLIDRQRAHEELRRHRDELELLVNERTEQLALEVEQRQHAYEALRVEQERLKELLAQHERDRRLVSYEIHDGLAQHLAGAIMEFQSLESLPADAAAESRAVIAACRRRLVDALKEARSLISTLRPMSLDEFGVESAINELILRCQADGGPTVEFISALSGRRLGPTLEIAVFRIVQECIANAQKHSGSQRLSVELTEDGDWLCLAVHDWGVGFDPTSVEGDHFGLEGIRERARLLDGQATVDSRPGHGTHITVRLPRSEA